MPVYEYHCEGCHQTLERMVPVEARDAQRCLRCEVPLVRKSGTPAFAIHGFNAANGYSKP
jgi:putative FmdB family regulatory protein